MRRVAAPLDNARAVLDLLAGCGDGGVPPPTCGPIKRLVARFARAKRVANTRRLKQDLILQAPFLRLLRRGRHERKASDVTLLLMFL